MWKFPLYNINEQVDWEAMTNQFSWFHEMQGVPQDKVWHAEGDVYTHTKMVVEALLNLPTYEQLGEQDKHILFAAAMLHDVEKRSTTATEIIEGKERIVSPGHAKRGEFTTRNFLYKELETPFIVREQIAKLVRYHGLPLWAMEKPDPGKTVIEVSLKLNTKLLALLARADVLGRLCEDQEEVLLRVDFFEELCKEQNCFGVSRPFNSDYGRYLFLNRPNYSPDYEPFDDLKFEVIMMCALPGSGKDTYIARNYPDLPVLSLDDIRRANKIKPTDKKGNGRVIQLAKEKAKVFMRSSTSFVFNATNLTKDMRGKWVSLFTDYGGKVKMIYLEVPYKKLLQQNQNREHQVPENIIDKMIHKLEIPDLDESHELSIISD